MGQPPTARFQIVFIGQKPGRVRERGMERWGRIHSDLHMKGLAVVKERVLIVFISNDAGMKPPRTNSQITVMLMKAKTSLPCHICISVSQMAASLIHFVTYFSDAASVALACSVL